MTEISANRKTLSSQQIQVVQLTTAKAGYNQSVVIGKPINIDETLLLQRETDA